ncbi:16S rRNA (guanine(527)-N(7))-methyltransferase RsmG [Scatolibacter rhodanostii]|uniref:16S rRNA (guanine(527)-N(7))-methyltransferase RsmG n=1 Tax=Scatolibacter rhodanostii TaxID=2014781 RepID=UPI000C07EA78|nr:16S rRNA (guanine(527)-N(7))-methyltransferase RsmG [Scatolibacter rhodanostii]
MEDIRKQIVDLFTQEDIEISDKQVEQFQTYYEVLLDWNNKINLTSIVESVKIIEKHFLDSVIILKKVKLDKGISLVDVGTGAGFPGIPLKIMRPDIELTLMDSLNKRVVFLEALCEALQIEADSIHIRAEDAGRDPVYRESFDVATARAVANMNILSEYCLPLVRKNGIFIAMKGPNLEDELDSAKRMIAELGAKTQKVENFSLPCGDERTLVVIQKKEKTSPKYPRHSSIISKKKS